MISFNTNLNDELDSLNIMTEVQFLSYPLVARPPCAFASEPLDGYPSADKDTICTPYNPNKRLIDELELEFEYAKLADENIHRDIEQHLYEREQVLPMKYMLGNTGMDMFEIPIPIDLGTYYPSAFITFQLEASVMARRIFKSFDYSNGKINVVKANAILTSYNKYTESKPRDKYTWVKEDIRIPVYLHTFMTEEYYNSINWNLPYLAPIVVQRGCKIRPGRAEVIGVTNVNDVISGKTLKISSNGIRTEIFSNKA